MLPCLFRSEAWDIMSPAIPSTLSFTQERKPVVYIPFTITENSGIFLGEDLKRDKNLILSGPGRGEAQRLG